MAPPRDEGTETDPAPPTGSAHLGAAPAAGLVEIGAGLMAYHADATHRIRLDRDPVSRVWFCRVCGRDLTEDEVEMVEEEQR